MSKTSRYFIDRWERLGLSQYDQRFLETIPQPERLGWVAQRLRLKSEEEIRMALVGQRAAQWIVDTAVDGLETVDWKALAASVLALASSAETGALTPPESGKESKS